MDHEWRATRQGLALESPCICKAPMFESSEIWDMCAGRSSSVRCRKIHPKRKLR